MERDEFVAGLSTKLGPNSIVEVHPPEAVDWLRELDPAEWHVTDMTSGQSEAVVVVGPTSHHLCIFDAKESSDGRTGFRFDISRMDEMPGWMKGRLKFKPANGADASSV